MKNRFINILKINKKFQIILNDCKEIVEKVNTSKLKGKKILILGSNSFLSTYIQTIIFFLNKVKNYKINTISISKNNPKENLKILLDGDKNFKFIKLNLSNNKRFENIIKRKFDYIFICATYGQPGKWMNNQMETFNLNVNLLNKIFSTKKKEKCKFMFFSSADVYGDTKTNLSKPIKENFKSSVEPSSPRSMYGMSKRMGETLCHYYRNYHKMKIYIIRAAHTYGPGMEINDKRVIIEFFRKAKKGKIDLLDEGKSIKTYGYIGDIAEMFFNIILHGKNHTYNTCGRDYISIISLAKKIKLLFKNCKLSVPQKNIKSNLKHISSDPSKSILSSSLYCKEFNKRKFKSLNLGLLNLKNYLNL